MRRKKLMKKTKKKKQKQTKDISLFTMDCTLQYTVKGIKTTKKTKKKRKTKGISQ